MLAATERASGNRQQATGLCGGGVETPLVEGVGGSDGKAFFRGHRGFVRPRTAPKGRIQGGVR